MNRQTDLRRVQTRYCAYLVRFWQDNRNDGWRASAQSVQGGDTVRFADLEQLFAFLRAQTAGQPPQEAQKSQDESAEARNEGQTVDKR